MSPAEMEALEARVEWHLTGSLSVMEDGGVCLGHARIATDLKRLLTDLLTLARRAEAAEARVERLKAVLRQVKDGMHILGRFEIEAAVNAALEDRALPLPAATQEPPHE